MNQKERKANTWLPTPSAGKRVRVGKSRLVLVLLLIG